MVGRTPPLSSIKKGIFPQIHHQIPLSPRESQQLLNTLTSSFRKNLDKEHPSGSPETASPRRTRPSSIPPPVASTATARDSQFRPTDIHLRSILSNPLFRETPNKTSSILDGTAPPATTPPNHVFDSAVSKGLMTPQRAAGYLVASRRHILQSDTLDIKAAMAESHAGLRVVQWLRASGNETKLAFLKDAAFVRLLLQFMSSEGLEEIAWTWLARLVAQSQSTSAEADLKLASNLLAAIVEVHATQATTKLDASYSALIRARQMMATSDSRHISNQSLLPSWLWLSWISTVNAWQRPKPSTPLFELYVDIGRTWDRSLEIAHLDLHHPASPDHQRAMGYLQYLNGLTRQDRRLEITAGNEGERIKSKRIVTMALDTVDRLKRIGQENEASWVEKLLSSRFTNWTDKRDYDYWDLVKPGQTNLRTS